MKLNCGKYSELFGKMQLDIKSNTQFLEFISMLGNKEKNINLEMLLNLEKDYPGIFVKVMTEFDNARLYRDSLDERGFPIKLSWEEAFKKFYLSSRYKNVTNENEDIAELFGNQGLSEEVFEQASKLREKAQKNNIPEHILQKTIKEETIIESIQRIKEQTEEEIGNAKQIIEELFDKQFTYEWLNKNDPHNAILGLFCSCCATITSKNYGKNIAESSIIVPEIQNLVVKNSKGEIVSKGSMYLNKEKGYAVINNFEINIKYRNHEKSRGIYEVDEKSEQEKDRELIFKAFQRGLKKFIEEYDRQNPNNPLKQINIGADYNRLKRQVSRFKRATVNLKVPFEYGFQDALEGQSVLYQRLEKQIENGGDER